MTFFHKTKVFPQSVLLSLDNDLFNNVPMSLNELIVVPKVKMVSFRFRVSSFNISSYNFRTVLRVYIKGNTSGNESSRHKQ